MRASRWVLREAGGETPPAYSPAKARNNPDADVVVITEGNTGGRVNASTQPVRRGRRPWHVWTFLVREPGGLGFGPRLDTVGPHRKDEES